MAPHLLFISPHDVGLTIGDASMTLKTALSIAAGLTALVMMGGTAAVAENHVAEDPMAESQAFLGSPTSMAQAIAAAEAATGGKVSGIEYEAGENGAPDLIMADVVMADGTEKTVALNPADGKVMSVTDATDEMEEGDTGDEGEGGEEGGEEGGSGSNG